MNLLILLNGNFSRILESNGLDAKDFEIVKLDEKVLSKPVAILRQMKTKKYDNAYFGTIELHFQRFQTFMKIYFFLSGIWRGALMDEYGHSNRFSFAKFLFREIPVFIFEVIWSGILVIFYHIKVLILRWKYQTR